MDTELLVDDHPKDKELPQNNSKLNSKRRTFL
jgi:hypothetical protein